MEAPLREVAEFAGVLADYSSADEAWRLTLRMLKIEWLPQESYVFFDRAAYLFAKRRNAALDRLRSRGIQAPALPETVRLP